MCHGGYGGWHSLDPGLHAHQGAPPRWRARRKGTQMAPPPTRQALPPRVRQAAPETSPDVPQIATTHAVGAGIRLAGATNDVHIFDVRTGSWEKISPQGEPPSPRAAHAAAAVGNMVVIQVGPPASNPSQLPSSSCSNSSLLACWLVAAVQGGIGPAGLASEDLHVLDFTDMERPRWHRCSLGACGTGVGVAVVAA